MTQKQDITQATPEAEATIEKTEQPESIVETVDVENKKGKKRLGKTEIQNTVLSLLANGTPEALAEAETLNKYFGVGNSIKELLEKRVKKEGLTTENIELIKKVFW